MTKDTHVFHVGEKDVIEHGHEIDVNNAIMYRNEKEIDKLRRWPETAVDLYENNVIRTMRKL